MENTRKNTRRAFIQKTVAGSLAFSLLPGKIVSSQSPSNTGKRIGMIGLDTSHSVAFTKEFNQSEAGPELGGYRVVAAYPKGSSDIESSYSRIPGYTEEMKALGVQIVDSIDRLLELCDVVMLETNDGRLHLEQAIPVLKAGKTLFIDKPITASLRDAMIIFDLAKQYNVPVFSSSSLRYVENVQRAAGGEIGQILGVFTFSPCHLEPTHPDLFWYGIHGVEMLYAVMGTGCKSVTRISTKDTDQATGTWENDRIGTFRGTRSGKSEYGGTAFGEKGILNLSPYPGYKPMLVEIVRFFQTGVAPVKPKETLEILAFMEAADESKRVDGARIELQGITQLARKLADEYLQTLNTK